MKYTTIALRRHHDKRLKKKRSLYSGLPIEQTLKLTGRRFQTPCCCSCWMCGNQRKHHGLKFQERKALAKANQDIKEFSSITGVRYKLNVTRPFLRHQIDRFIFNLYLTLVIFYSHNPLIYNYYSLSKQY